MPVVKALSNSLTTPNLPVTLAFYRDLLGFEVTGQLGEPDQLQWVELAQGDIRLMLLAAEPGLLTERYFQASGVIFYYNVADLQNLMTKIRSAGHEISEMEVTFYGMRECYLKDPDGRQLTIAEPSEEGDLITITEL